MAFLDASGSVRVTLASASAVDFEASYLDIDTSAATLSMGHAVGVASAVGNTLIVAAPASNRRQVKRVTLYNRDVAAVTASIERWQAGSVYPLTPKVSLQPGELLEWIDGVGARRLDATGRLMQRESAGGQESTILLPKTAGTANLTSVKSLTTTNAFAVYVGRAPRALSGIEVRYRVTTAAATITWAEVAVAKGAPTFGTNPNLTVVGWADVSAVINSTGQKSTTINVSSGQAINEGDDLWLLIGNQATTVGVVRALSIADDLQTGVQASAVQRPSLIVGSPTSFTIEGATTLPAWIVGRV